MGHKQSTLRTHSAPSSTEANDHEALVHASGNVLSQQSDQVEQSRPITFGPKKQPDGPNEIDARTSRIEQQTSDNPVDWRTHGCGWCGPNPIINSLYAQSAVRRAIDDDIGHQLPPRDDRTGVDSDFGSYLEEPLPYQQSPPSRFASEFDEFDEIRHHTSPPAIPMELMRYFKEQQDRLDRLEERMAVLEQQGPSVSTGIAGARKNSEKDDLPGEQAQELRGDQMPYNFSQIQDLSGTSATQDADSMEGLRDDTPTIDNSFSPISGVGFLADGNHRNSKRSYDDEPQAALTGSKRPRID